MLVDNEPTSELEAYEENNRPFIKLPIRIGKMVHEKNTPLSFKEVTLSMLCTRYESKI